MPNGDAQLDSEIAEFIENEGSGEFQNLFLRLFARQYARNEPYRIYCDNLGASPDRVRRWLDVPAVPARAFKLTTLSCAPPDKIERRFFSSGTTGGQRSVHALDRRAAELYTISLRAGFRRVVPRNLPVIALMPPPSEAPNSSLSYMLDKLGAERFFWDDVSKLADDLDRRARERSPVCVFGTAFALLDALGEGGARVRLPPGSVVVETGGFKGRTRQVSRQELYALIEQRLGVPTPQILAEYGMSEMASQYYGTLASGLSAPHWLRSRILDPLTECDADEGLLAHYDLANWNSAAAIQTQDMARRNASGAFELLGRAPGAELRGCSLSVEERWAKLRQA